MESASQFGHTGPSPPPASPVRRHHSVNYPNGPKRVDALRRSETLKTPPIKTYQPKGYPSGQSPSPTGAEEDEHEQEEDPRLPVTQGSHSPSVGISPPWENNDWRAPVDGVSDALKTLELNAYQSSANHQPLHGPPRFYPNHQAAQQQQNLRGGSQSGITTPGLPNNGGRRLNLGTYPNDGWAGQGLPQGVGGPASSSTYIPAIGHGVAQRDSDLRGQGGERPQRDRAASAGQWEQKDRVIVGRSSNPNLSGSYRNGGGNGGNNSIPNVPPIPPQFLNNQGQAPRLGQNQNHFGVVGGVTGNGQHGQNQGGGVNGGGTGMSSAATQFPIGSDNLITSPVDVPTLLATKGYNPVEFDIKPPCVGSSGPFKTVTDR